MTTKNPLPDGLQDAIGDVVVGFDRAGVGREIGLASLSSIPHLASQRDPELVTETILAATSNVVAIMDGLIDGTDPQSIPVPTVSLDWIDSLIARNIDLTVVPWAYSFGNGRMSDALRDVVGHLDLSGEDRWDLGEALTHYVQTYVESICAQMVDHYIATRDTWRAGTPALRRAMVSTLLAGDPVDVSGASGTLGYDVSGAHLAAIVWSTATGGERPDARRLEASAAALLRACGATQVLTVANPDSSVWAWGAGEQLHDSAPAETRLECGMLGALGTVTSGVGGFARSHADAQRARHVCLLMADSTRTIVPYRTVALTSLIAADTEQAVRFVESELGGLTDDSDVARRLRATLAVYLDEGMRPVRAARRLGVHQNTVLYRIAQAETLIGRPLSERRLELETALRLSDALTALRSAAETGAD